MMRCTIWYHLYNLKNVKNTHRGVLILVKLQANFWQATNVTSSIPKYILEQNANKNNLSILKLSQKNEFC